MTRIDNIGRNGNDGDHYFQREDRYLVLKRSDIEAYLSMSEQIQLDSIIRGIELGRYSDGKPTYTKYVVVSEKWKPVYEDTWQAIEKYSRVPEPKYDMADDALDLGKK